MEGERRQEQAEGHDQVDRDDRGQDVAQDLSETIHSSLPRPGGGNQQSPHDCEEKPIGTKRQRFRQGQAQSADCKEGEHCRPTGLSTGGRLHHDRLNDASPAVPAGERCQIECRCRQSGQNSIFGVGLRCSTLESIMRQSNSIFACVALSVFAASVAHAQSAGQNTQGRGDAEARAAKAYQAAMGNGPLALYAFLEDFPKGADLHVHLSGAVYAESFIRAAGEDGLCVDTVALKFAKPPCDGKLVAAGDVPKNQDLYDRLVDSFSMRSYVPTASFSGHDQFFSTFEKFGGLNKRHVGEWVDEVASRAAAQNEQYLELMETPTFNHAAKIAYELGWNPDFAAFRQALLDHGLRDEVEEDR